MKRSQRTENTPVPGGESHVRRELNPGLFFAERRLLVRLIPSIPCMLELPSLLLAALSSSKTYVMSIYPPGHICTVSHSRQHISSGLSRTARNSGRNRRAFRLKKRRRWLWAISGSHRALLASLLALLSAPVGNYGRFEGNPERRVRWNRLGRKIHEVKCVAGLCWVHGVVVV